MRTVYIADDGTQFDDEFECEDYEWKLNHPHLKDVRCYDKDGNELKNIFSENTYGYSQKIIVPTDEAARDLQELSKYTGYCYYGHIAESGTWVYKERNYNRGFVLQSKEID